MADRTRPIRIEFCVTEQEKELIESKMAQLGTRNMGAYLRKMAIDGYIVCRDCGAVLDPGTKQKLCPDCREKRKAKWMERLKAGAKIVGIIGVSSI